MRVLIDECLPVRCRHLITGHDVRTVEFMGWKALKNGRLVEAAVGHFDVIVTADRRFTGKKRYKIPVVIVPSNIFDDLVAIKDRSCEAVDAIGPGERIEL